MGSTSEPTASESVVTSEGLSEGEVPAALDSSKQTYDYSEGVESASSLSTPKGDENPFEQDNLGDTVIHFGDVSAIVIISYATHEDNSRCCFHVHSAICNS